MSTTEATNVVPPPPASPAAAPVTAQHISALHRHLDELGAFVKSEFDKVIAFVSKAAPVAEAAAAAVAPVVGGPVAGIVAAVEKVAGVVVKLCSSCEGKLFPNGICQNCGKRN